MTVTLLAIDCHIQLFTPFYCDERAIVQYVKAFECTLLRSKDNNSEFQELFDPFFSLKLRLFKNFDQ